MAEDFFSKERLNETRTVTVRKPFTGLSKGFITKADTPYHSQFLTGLEKGIYVKKHFSEELKGALLCDTLLGKTCAECAKPKKARDDGKGGKKEALGRNNPQEVLILPTYIFDFINQKATDKDGKVLEYDLSPECAFEIKVSGDTEGNDDKIRLYDSEGALTNDVWELSALKKEKPEMKLKWLQLKPPTPLDAIASRNFKKMFGDNATVPVDIVEKWENRTVAESRGHLLSACLFLTDDQWKFLEERGAVVRPAEIERGTPIGSDDEKAESKEEPEVTVSFNRKK